MEQNQEIINEFMSEVDTGAFSRKVSAYLAEVASNVARHDKVGKLSMTFDIKPAKNTNQTGAGVKANIISKVSYVRPTMNGKLAEENITETPMVINKDGSITLLAKSHDDMFDEKVSLMAKQ